MVQDLGTVDLLEMQHRRLLAGAERRVLPSAELVERLRELESPRDRTRATRALLGLASLPDPDPRRTEGTGRSHGQEAAVATERLLRWTPWFGEVLVREVALDRESAIASRRRAFRVLRDVSPRVFDQAIVLVGNDAKDPARLSLLRLALDRPTAGLDRVLAQVFTEDPVQGATLLSRRCAVGQPLAERAAALLLPSWRAGLLEADWRKVVLAIRLGEVFAPGQEIPVLLDALEEWEQRLGEGERGLRVQGDLVTRLEDLSGRRLGLRSASWRAWWLAVCEQRTPLEAGVREGEVRTSAGFFGLELRTDRVCFILDGSGSMDQFMGTDGRSRYDQALLELERCLRGLDPSVEFRVIRFSDGPLLDSGPLRRVTESSIKAALRSLRARPPGGGTALAPALERGLGPLLEGRAPDQDSADTFVILCDGAAADCQPWVQQHREGTLDLGPVRIHGVLLQTAGDGVLQELAEFTGGRCVRVP